MRVVDFSDVAELISGVTFKKADSRTESKPGTIGVLRAGNIQDSELRTDDLVYVPTRFVNPSQLLKDGDVLIASSSGSLDIVGKAAAVTFDVNLAFGAFCKVARPKRKVIHPGYFKHFFRSTEYIRRVRERAEGANINNLNRGDFLSLQVPLPPLEEQKRIAGILDEADLVRKKTQALIDKYDELAQNLFLDMFGDPVNNPKGWEVKSLESQSEKICVGFVGTCEPFYCDEDEGVPLLRTGNLGDGQLKMDKLKFVTREFHLANKKSQIKRGDILIARHGDNGKAVSFQASWEEANCLNIVLLRPKSDVSSSFMEFLLNCESVRRLVASKSGGATQKVINTRKIQSLELPFPSQDLQLDFDNRIGFLKRQKNLVQLDAACAENLFSSLLQKAFKGELT